jgi:flagellin-like protein
LQIPTDKILILPAGIGLSVHMTAGPTSTIRRPFCHKDRKGVSPIVAEILMVSITIVLTGSLVIYLTSNQNQTGQVAVPIGTTLEKQSTGNWTLTVVNGKTIAINAIIVVKNPDTGVATVNTPITTQSWYYFFNDNNANGYLDGGDVILLNQTAGIIQSGWRLEIVKQEGTLSGPLKIP